ncbi:MAG: DUF4352 domain-containing protein [Anaerolineales bacterium]
MTVRRPPTTLILALMMTLAGCAGGWGSVIDALGITPLAGTQDPDPFGNYTPIAGMGIPTAAPPARIGVEVVAGSLAMKVTQVVRPGDGIVNRASSRLVPEANEEFVMVDIEVRCLSSASDTCYVTEFDFGITSSSGRDYTPEFSSAFSGLQGLFEGGAIPPGESMAGSIVYIIPRDEVGLVLEYPRLFPLPGSRASLILEP